MNGQWLSEQFKRQQNIDSFESHLMFISIRMNLVLNPNHDFSNCRPQLIDVNNFKFDNFKFDNGSEIYLNVEPDEVKIVNRDTFEKVAQQQLERLLSMTDYVQVFNCLDGLMPNEFLDEFRKLVVVQENQAIKHFEKLFNCLNLFETELGWEFTFPRMPGSRPLMMLDNRRKATRCIEYNLKEIIRRIYLLFKDKSTKTLKYLLEDDYWNIHVVFETLYWKNFNWKLHCQTSSVCEPKASRILQNIFEVLFAGDSDLSMIYNIFYDFVPKAFINRLSKIIDVHQPSKLVIEDLSTKRIYPPVKKLKFYKLCYKYVYQSTSINPFDIDYELRNFFLS